MQVKKKQGRPKVAKAKKLTQIVIAVPFSRYAIARKECLAIEAKHRSVLYR